MASSIQDLANLAERSLPAIDDNFRLVTYYRSAQQMLMQVLLIIHSLIAQLLIIALTGKYI